MNILAINILTISSMLIVFCSVLMIVLLFMKGRGRKLSIICEFLCLSLFLWGVGGFKISLIRSKQEAFLWWQFSHIGIIFIPTFFFHFVYSFLDLRKKFLLRIVYLTAAILVGCNIFVPNLFLGNLRFVFGKFFWVSRTYLFFVYFFFLCGGGLSYAFILMIKNFKHTLGIKRVQLKYFILAATIAWVGGGANYMITMGMSLYPYLNFLIALYPAILVYAIIKHRLLDISVALTRTTIFIAVYSLVLGLPFLVAFGMQEWLKSYIGEMWWLTPLILLTILATGGPFIYLAIQRRAEEKLFADQRRYQATLRQAATGMGRIKDMEKLVGLIVHIVTRSVRVEHSVVFLKDSGGKRYKFEGARARQPVEWTVKELDAKAPLIRMLNRVQQPIVYSELQQRAVDNPQSKLGDVVKEMEALRAELVVPSFVDENMIAFMVMGRKVSGELYSDNDISVFSILASQAALAIENCQFYRDMRATHEQLFQAEKMATIGIMADGLSHQINNRLHALGFIAGDALDTIMMKKNAQMTDEMKEVMVDIEHALTRIQENVTQGGEIVRGLLKYSRKQDETFTEVELGELIEESFKMAQFKIKKDALDLVRDLPAGLPKIKGNFTELQEVFFNLFDNAYDAMMQRKEELGEEGYRPTIEIKAEARGGNRMNITIMDNGIGIKEEDQIKIFTPFFTTKLSSKKGTGLGLYVIKKLIEENHKGRVAYRSEYMQGTKVYVTLPTVLK